MLDHKCGCKTTWDDELGHPMYLAACGAHRRDVPNGWLVAPKKLSRTRETVKA